VATSQSAPAGTTYPGKTLGIIGLIVAFPFSLIGLVLSIVALVQSKRAGNANTPAVIGIIVGAVLLVGWVILLGILITVFGSLFAQCAELGSGTHYVNGVTYTCS
jgi:hypothetical protein